MEGDVLMAGGAPLPMLLVVAGAVLGGVFALLKWFAGRLLADIEKRIHDVDSRLDKLAAELPIHYMRREDHIRELTAIHVKLDRLYELLLRDRP